MLFALFAGVALLVQTCLATGVVSVPSSLQQKRDNVGRDFSPSTGPHAWKPYVFYVFTNSPNVTLDQTSDILDNMAMGLPFVGVQLGNHTAGTDDQASLNPGMPDNLPAWPDRAFEALERCAIAANETLYDAVEACGPAETCPSEFAVMSFWGVLQGMNYVQDGLMLTQCLAYQTVKANCAKPIQAPCELSAIGDFHEAMWPAFTNVTFIGTGATSPTEMAQQIQQYNDETGTSYALPST